MPDAAATRLFPHAEAISNCPICGSAQLRHFVRSVDYHYQIPGEFDLSRCLSCQVAFANPMPTPADLAALYPDDYYSFQTPALPHWLKRRVKQLLGLSRYTYLPRFARPGRMLDVGCGAGQYLLEMRARGWEVYGSELNKGAAAAGRRAGIDIRGGELADAAFAAEWFDFVRLNHSFEHMPNPRAVLAEIHRILKPDGKLFIGVPNLSGLMARVFGRYWWYMGLPVHTFAYNPRNLSQLLQSAGFVVEKVRYGSDYGGVLGSLQILCNRNKFPRSSDGSVVKSKLLRLPGQYFARLLDLLRLGDCIEVIAVKSPGDPR
jgi:SAM-dependent methyltransferase